MTDEPVISRAGNPFSTRHVRPGCIEPLDETGRPVDLLEMLDSLNGLGGLASLVGPHGSGKTTLLWALAAAIEESGHRVVRVRMYSAGDLGMVLVTWLRRGRCGTLCIDGWERLGIVSQICLAAVARLTGTRLVVTAHRKGFLPVLRSCRTSPDLLLAIVDRLPPGSATFGPQDIGDAFHRSGGDIREALFLLYDRFEERSRATAG